MKFKIDNMNCMSCVQNISQALKEFDRSLEITADIKNKTITVKSNHSVDVISKVIKESGYMTTEIKAD